MENQDRQVYNQLIGLMDAMRQSKPEERSEKARRYAVTITELEKVQAYFEVFILTNAPANEP